MNIQEITNLLVNAGIPENEAKIEIKLLMEHFFNFTEKDKLLGKTINDEQLNLLKQKVEYRISERIPVQHIIGEAYFMGNYFKVNPDVLIPRDETEILVSEVIKIIKNNNFKTVLDIGTGSGCIACTIAKNTNATALGVDISSDALRIALDNVTKLGINNRAVFRKSDLFDKIHSDEKFDIIVSNPPYIPFGTKLDPEVMKEPHIALFANDDGLSFYKKIITDAPNFLNKKGYIAFELGINESEKVKELLSRDFENIYIIKDFANIDRVIIANLK